MGRPLFSSLYHNDIPISTVRPEKQLESEKPYTTWSRECPFDPDSDDFFTSPDAVYEAVIDEPKVSEEMPTNDDDEASSEVSVTDVGQPSPMAVGSDDPTRMLSAYAYISQWEHNYRRPVTDGDSHSEPAVSHQEHSVHNLVDARLRTTDITPITLSRSTTPTLPPASIPTIIRPVTPPASSQPHYLFTPSPAPTVTPRPYGWGSHFSSFSLSPSHIGPLSNPDARVSLSHISHALPVHNVA